MKIHSGILALIVAAIAFGQKVEPGGGGGGGGSGTIAITTNTLAGDGAGNAIAVTGTGTNCVLVNGTSTACSGGSISGLTTNAIVNAASATSIQTPSATTTLDSSGNAVFAGNVQALTFTSGATPPTKPSGGTGGAYVFGEGTVPTGGCPTAGVDCLVAVSSTHTLDLSNNNGTLTPILISSATGIQNFLTTPSSANLAAALTDGTGTGAAVFATSPTLVTPILGTPTSGNLANTTGYPAAALPTITLTGNVTGSASGGSIATTISNTSVTNAMLSGSIATTKLASLQGTDTNLLTAGTVSGTAATLCTDANGGATTVGCSGTGANTALSNLSSVSINTSLLPQSGVSLGASGTAFQNLFLYGSGTFGSTSMEVTGTPTGNRVWTLQDATDTLVGRATTDTFTNKTFDTGGTGNSLKIAGTAISSVSGSGAVCLSTGSACATGGGVTGTSVTSVTPVTANANSTADQQMMELSLGAGYFNSAKQPFQFFAAGIYTTQTLQTPTVTFKAKLCTVSGCGSGTVVTLNSIVSTATLAGNTNNNWILSFIGMTATTGATGNLEVHGPLTIDLGATTTTADSIFSDTNTAVSGNIDLTAALFLDFTVTFSTQPTTPFNAATQRSGGVMPFAAVSAPVTSLSGDGALISNSSSTGNVTIALATAGAHKFWMNNTGSTAAPGYESAALADLPGTVVNASSPGAGIGHFAGSTQTLTSSAVVSADLNITTTTCTAPSVLTALSATAVGTCTTPVLTPNSQSAAYTTVLTDSGKMIYHPGADTTARTWTIDSNSNVAYPVGTCISFFNDTSAGTVTIAITSDTLVLAGTGTTGSRTLAASGEAIACKMTTVRWMIAGNGLT